MIVDQIIIQLTEDAHGKSEPRIILQNINRPQQTRTFKISQLSKVQQIAIQRILTAKDN